MIWEGMISATIEVLFLFTILLLIVRALGGRIRLLPQRRKGSGSRLAQKLRRGHSYLVREESTTQTTRMLVEHISDRHKGLLFTRAQPTRAMGNRALPNTPIVWMTNTETGEPTVKPHDLAGITHKVRDFIADNQESIIVIQRLDYLMTENDFVSVLRMIHTLNDIIFESRATLLVGIDPSTVSAIELTRLRKELRELPGQEKANLGEPLHSVLVFVYSENVKSRTPSFKSVTKRFAITKTTARKRLYELEGKGLLKILTQGRYKFLEVTDKGKAIAAGYRR